MSNPRSNSPSEDVEQLLIMLEQMTVSNTNMQQKAQDVVALSNNVLNDIDNIVAKYTAPPVAAAKTQRNWPSEPAPSPPEVEPVKKPDEKKNDPRATLQEFVDDFNSIHSRDRSRTVNSITDKLSQQMGKATVNLRNVRQFVRDEYQKMNPGAELPESLQPKLAETQRPEKTSAPEKENKNPISDKVDYFVQLSLGAPKKILNNIGRLKVVLLQAPENISKEALKNTASTIGKIQTAGESIILQVKNFSVSDIISKFKKSGIELQTPQSDAKLTNRNENTPTLKK